MWCLSIIRSLLMIGLYTLVMLECSSYAYIISPIHITIIKNSNNKSQNLNSTTQTRPKMERTKCQCCGEKCTCNPCKCNEGRCCEKKECAKDCACTRSTTTTGAGCSCLNCQCVDCNCSKWVNPPAVISMWVFLFIVSHLRETNTLNLYGYW